MAEPLLFEREGALVMLTLNRGDIRNPLGEAEDADAFAAAARRINTDPTVKVAILTGAGPAFSAGGNIKAMRERQMSPEKSSDIAVREHYRNTIHRMVRAIWGIEVPLIAAVNGPAIGLGNDVACLADTRIASEKAIFGATFLRMGLVPGDGGAWILPRIIGLARASELLFAGDTIDAKTALAWGLVSRVVAPDQLLPEAKALALRMAEQSSAALRMTKRLLRESQTAAFDSIMELSAAMQALAHTTPEHHAAVDAFLARSKKS